MSGGAGRFQVVPAAYVLLVRGDAVPSVLLQLRRGTGYMDGHWAAAAAGHVEQGEPADVAACREAQEELGLGLRPDELKLVTTMHRTTPGGGAGEERVDLFFVCRRWDGVPVLQEPDKAADLRWFPLAALPDPVVPHERAVLDALAAGRAPRFMAFGFPSAAALPGGRAQHA